MTEERRFVVDAFTAVPFRGNPGSVCVLSHDLADITMQAIAAEMNHSETAFLRPLDGTAGDATDFSLRWFTPQVEVPPCGHATLAASAKSEVYPRTHPAFSALEVACRFSESS